jgi:hypothetical protein
MSINYAYQTNISDEKLIYVNNCRLIKLMSSQSQNTGLTTSDQPSLKLWLAKRATGKTFITAELHNRTTAKLQNRKTAKQFKPTTCFCQSFNR